MVLISDSVISDSVQVEPHTRFAIARAVRVFARSIIGRAARADQRTRDVHDPVQVARGDAGWVQILDVDEQRLRGRGHLMLQGEPDSRAGEPRFLAQLESFVPADGPQLVPGERAFLLIESANEQYPIVVQEIEPGGSIVRVSWTSAELPAPLRELGGE